MIPEEQICPYCKEDKRIRNPTGNCDHLYYPENVNKNFHSPASTTNPKNELSNSDSLGAGRFVKKYIKFKNECVERKIFDLDEIIKLYGVFITS